MAGRFFRGAAFLTVAALLCTALLGIAPPLDAQTKQDAVFSYHEGRAFMMDGDYYGAAQSFLEGLKVNPAHAEATASLAECYYYLGEYEEALGWVRKARVLARANLDTANLEAFILAAIGQLDEAEGVLKTVLQAEPYNKEALFVQGEIDMARGRNGDALIRYREAVRRYPDDRRLLLSLALVSLSLNDYPNAQGYIDRAMTAHPDDYRVYYYAAWLSARRGDVGAAAAYVEKALYYKEDFAPALALLTVLRYRTGEYEEAVRLADGRIAANRNDTYAHYLKGLSLWRLGEADPTTAEAHFREARAALDTVLTINGDNDDEFARALLEEILLRSTSLEDPSRARYAAWHFRRAADFRQRNLSDEALFEYRRGLRLNPYAAERRDYAETLRFKGYTGAYLNELLFIKELRGTEDADIDDAIETYTALNREALPLKYQIGIEELSRHWQIALYTIDAEDAPPSAYHTDNAVVAAVYLKDVLVHDRNIAPGGEAAVRRSSFADAFRASRTRGDDYFLIIALDENERDLLLKATLYASRTGTELKTFTAYRSGENRLRNAARAVTDQLNAVLPFRASLIRRNANIAVIDKGRIDGVTQDSEYEVVKQGTAEIATDGVALKYGESVVVGTFKPTQIDEEVSLGILTRRGFFDRLAVGDDVILQPRLEQAPAQPATPRVGPELQALLRTLR
ncbi:MAG: tetratricopeptide repeat protein [Spirochaetaceae bacterium]|jgi:tetratricopeptide (TPR) repeat protein|nr:tetratricopeptide repeat protein [Spirochaetaceae bacterium]